MCFKYNTFYKNSKIKILNFLGTMKDPPTSTQWNNMNNREKVEALTACYVLANAKTKEDPFFAESARNLFGEMECALLENRESAELRLWREWRALTIAYLEDFYTQFEIDFNEWTSESEQISEGNRITDELIANKIAFRTADNRWVVKGKSDKDLAVLRKSDNSTLYLTRHILICL